MTPGIDLASAQPQFFATPTELRAWFAEHHDKRDELWVGFFKKGSGRTSITWAESVDEALCVGWIDGVRKGLDEQSYLIRFTPRKKRSTWSLTNIRRVEELRAQGRMHSRGLAAFESRTDDNSGIYSFEQESIDFDEQFKSRFRAQRAAWEWFEQQPASYRKAATWWVMSAKRPDTRARRLEQLIDQSRSSRRLAHLVPPPPISRGTSRDVGMMHRDSRLFLA